MYQRTVLRDLLTRLEVVLADEGVDPATVVRVIRCMLYGSPSEANARLRMAHDQRLMELARRVAPMPIDPVDPCRPAATRLGQ
jgi:hypothetical protein